MRSTIHFVLIGQRLGHTFSPQYFSEKWQREAAPALAQRLHYSTAELPQIIDVRALLQRGDLCGANVTIPYKTAIMPYLYAIAPCAASVGAVNTLVRDERGRWWGYNTDVVGFNQSLLQAVDSIAGFSLRSALILGTGGASKAVQTALQWQNVPFRLVSRTSSEQTLSYDDLRAEEIEKVDAIINTTPLGMYPDVESCPALPYEAVSEKHLAVDLVYNPAKTVFLQRCAAQGAHTLGGLPMLHLQADAAWRLWQSSPYFSALL